MCRPRTDTRSAHSRASGNAAVLNIRRGTLAAIAVGIWLAGCTDPGLYLDRRDTIALGGGDAIAGNTIGQMVDPWPPDSGNKNIAFNGQKMQAAQERYRTGKVIQPLDPENLTSTNQTAPSINTTVNTGSAAPASTPGQ